MRSVDLHDVVVKAAKMREHANGEISLDTKMFNSLPQILGSADPLRFTQLLPEIQTNGEYRSGINIQGCESSHNLVSIGEVPIYNPSHLLGFFSTFNAPHFNRFSITKAPSSKTSNRLGGELKMDIPRYLEDSLSGDVSVGMMQSQGTIRLPIGKKTLLKVSLRASYINLLFNSWLSFDKSDIRYSFYDSNITLLHKFNNKHSLVIDYYGGNDNCIFKERSYAAHMNADWGNQMVAVHHRFTPTADLHFSNSAYFTSYRNVFSFGMQDVNYRIPSSIKDFGLKHNGMWKNLSWGADVACHHICPQSLETSGTSVSNHSVTTKNNTCELSAYAVYTQPFSDWLKLEAGLRGNLYGSQQTGYFSHVDPSVSLTYNNYNVEVYAGYSIKHQYLFQTGFSNAGLPTEYWMSSNKDFRPQYAHSINIGTSLYLFARKYKLSGNVFYKKLYNQIEYFGSIFDFVNSNYDLNKHLLQGNGENYGFSAIINKCYGKLNGWVSYTYTHAQRDFLREDGMKRYAASHERPHEINGVLTYDLSSHWTFGGTIVYASGTPYTSAKYLALINGNIIANFGEHNANRLSPYYRLDVSVNYKWKSRFAKENGLNLSFYNVTCHDNALFCNLRIKEDGSFSYKSRSFIVNILPSLSYFCKF